MSLRGGSMSKKNKRDKQLLENLERILKGQSIEDSSSMDDETRAALDLVRKMMSLHEAPSKEYTQKLKAQLIHQLAQQEKKEESQKQGFGLWQFPRITAWQATVSAALVVIVAAFVFLVLNGIGSRSPSEEEPGPPTTVTGTTISPSAETGTTAPSETTKPGTATNTLIAQAVVDKPVYMVGEHVNIQITIKSDYNYPVIFDKFPPYINLKHVESGKIQTLTGVLLNNITIEPGRTKIFNVEWNTENVTTGNYTVELGVIYSYGAPVKVTFTSPIFSVVNSN
jgi:hypothetical protein